MPQPRNPSGHLTDCVIDALRAGFPGFEAEPDDEGLVAIRHKSGLVVTAAPMPPERICLACQVIAPEGAASGGTLDANWTTQRHVDADITWTHTCEAATGEVVLSSSAPVRLLDTVACRDWFETFVDRAISLRIRRST
jgi:hypothetical protein